MHHIRRSQDDEKRSGWRDEIEGWLHKRIEEFAWIEKLAEKIAALENPGGPD